ncbi:MAG: tyrosine-type recombinase/integrase [Saprospiraceae bacterium]
MPIHRGTPKVRFNLQPAKAGATQYIILFFHYPYRGETVRFRFSTGYRVDPKHWSKDTQRVKFTRALPECQEINNRLNELENHTIAIWEENKKNPIHPEDFRQELIYKMGWLFRPEETKQTPTLFQFIEVFIQQEQAKANAERGTWKKYLTTFNHLKAFAKDTGKPVDYQDINWQFRHAFSEWCFAAPRKHSANTVNKSLDTIRKFMREALKAGYHSNSIFEQKGFSIKRVKVRNKVRLDRNELQTLLELDFSHTPRLERVRDLFIVGAYSGQRYSDWNQINRESVFVNEKGKEMVKVMTTKTRKQVIIPVLPELKKVLEKYEYQLPELAIQNFNTWLKEVFEIAFADAKFLRIYSEGGNTKSEIIEKWKKASSHAARRSFVSNFLLLGIPAKLIMQITGHATEKQLYEYADIEPEEIAEKFLNEVEARK